MVPLLTWLLLPKQPKLALQCHIPVLLQHSLPDYQIFKIGILMTHHVTTEHLAFAKNSKSISV
jgi:hypothetical protein